MAFRGKWGRQADRGIPPRPGGCGAEDRIDRMKQEILFILFILFILSKTTAGAGQD